MLLLQAPGTFGFDHTKYRPREVNGIPMYEFQHRLSDTIIPEVEEDRGRSSTAKNDDTRPAYVQPQGSPIPVSRNANKGKERVPEIRVTRPTLDMELENAKNDAGCCKCVIM